MVIPTENRGRFCENLSRIYFHAQKCSNSVLIFAQFRANAKFVRSKISTNKVNASTLTSNTHNEHYIHLGGDQTCLIRIISRAEYFRAFSRRNYFLREIAQIWIFVANARICTQISTEFCGRCAKRSQTKCAKICPCENLYE